MSSDRGGQVEACLASIGARTHTGRLLEVNIKNIPTSSLMVIGFNLSTLKSWVYSSVFRCLNDFQDEL